MKTVHKRHSRNNTSRRESGQTASPPSPAVYNGCADRDRLISELEMELTQLKMREQEHQHIQRETEGVAGYYSGLFHAAPVGYLVLSTAGTILEINQVGCNLLHRKPQEIKGKPFTLLLPEDEVPVFLNHLSRCRHSKKQVVSELMVRVPSGTLVAMELVSTAALGSDHLVHLRTVMMDITERRQAEQTYQERERNYRNLVNSIEGIVWEGTEQPRLFTFVSQQAEQILGYPVERWVNEPEFWENLIHADDRKRVLNVRLQAVMDRRGYLVEFRMHDSKRRIVWLRDTANAVLDAKGRVRLQGVMVNITDLKEAEEALRDVTMALEQRVAERTAQLEASNRELEAFSYSVSHDLRAPLRSIDAFSQLVREDYQDKLDEQGREYLNIVSGASQQMARLIDDLLHLSRVSRSEMRRGSVDLSALGESIICGLRRLEPQRHVEVHIAPGLRAEGDGQLLRVVLENLLNNAWKFTSKRPDARIELNCELQDKQRVFFVRDNGAGFDMAYTGKLFGAFQRLHSVSDFPGHGIGLATVQRIINRHGGRIWADAAVDRGATFYFTLPE